MKSGFEALGRMQLQAVLLLAAVFLIGVLGGIAFERAVHRPMMPPRHDGPPRGALPPGLSDGLDLTAEQERGIMAILERGRPQTEAVLDEFLPRLRAVTDSVRAEIRTLLTPEQQGVFDLRQPPLLGEEGRPPFPGPPPHHGR